MADKKKRRVIKPADTVREQIAKSADKPEKKRRVRASLHAGSKRLTRVAEFGQREYHPIKLPDNKVGRFMTKKRRLFPSFFVEAWQELRQVVWPNRKETTKLTVAVIVFALIFGGLVALVDYGIDKLFRNLILN